MFCDAETVEPAAMRRAVALAAVLALQVMALATPITGKRTTGCYRYPNCNCLCSEVGTPGPHSLPAARFPAGLQQRPFDVELTLAAADQAIRVATEQQLLAALGSGDLGWGDSRAVQLTADIQLSATLLISRPVRVQGRCLDSGSNSIGGGSRRCVLSGGGGDGASLPLLHVTGPAAIVELAHLELSGGVGSGSLAGALTASNHSMVELVGVKLSGNAAASGGAVRVDSHARLGMTGCQLEGNTAEVGAGGFILT